MFAWRVEFIIDAKINPARGLNADVLRCLVVHLDRVVELDVDGEANAATNAECSHGCKDCCCEVLHV